jgi:hypothetical protein
LIVDHDFFFIVTGNDFGSSKTNPGQSPKHHFCCERVRAWNTDNLTSWSKLSVVAAHAIPRKLYAIKDTRHTQGARRPNIRGSHRQNLKLTRKKNSWSTIKITSIVLL